VKESNETLSQWKHLADKIQKIQKEKRDLEDEIENHDDRQSVSLTPNTENVQNKITDNTRDTERMHPIGLLLLALCFEVGVRDPLSPSSSLSYLIVSVRRLGCCLLSKLSAITKLRKQKMTLNRGY
jgi:Mg2+ and Co2+ transporter CorA